MGLGESYTGVQGTVRTARWLLVKDCIGQKMWLRDRGPYLRGPADDVTLRHYGVCDICRSFGDTFCITASATVVHVCKQRCRPRAQ